MSEKDRPLPIPPKARFGAGGREGETADIPLMADRIAEAADQGRLAEFLNREFPDSEQARSLVTMMMGMMGMMPTGSSQPASPENGKPPVPAESGVPAPGTPAERIPEDLFSTIQGGDVKELMDILRREHQKRSSGAETSPNEAVAPAQPPEQPLIDKEVIDALISIASDNGVTMDWIIFRAIRLYIEEYKKTGRL